MARIAVLRSIEALLVLVGIAACEPAEAGGATPDEDEPTFEACLDDHGELEASCTDDHVCVRSGAIAGANVCAPTGCEVDDECSAGAECRTDVVDGEATCVLACEGFADCPDGMVCGAGICLWVPPR
jgi:hypothetical protein